MSANIRCFSGFTTTSSSEQVSQASSLSLPDVPLSTTARQPASLHLSWKDCRTPAQASSSAEHWRFSIMTNSGIGKPILFHRLSARFLAESLFFYFCTDGYAGGRLRSRPCMPLLFCFQQALPALNSLGCAIRADITYIPHSGKCERRFESTLFP